MSDEPSSGFDPRLVETWITGWTRARAVVPPVPERGGWRVEVGWPEQRRRHVFPALTDCVRDLGETVTEPWVFLKVCAAPEAVGAVLPDRWVLQAPSFMMTRASPEPETEVVVPAGYRLELDGMSPVAAVRIVTADAAVAASGLLVEVDGLAIYDRIVTDPGHRRRGLGRAVMTALAAVGRRRGATGEILAATLAGRALYETLGWRVLSPYTSAVIPGQTI